VATRRAAELSERELAVLQAYLDTGSVKGAAIVLGLHTRTVKAHLQHARTRNRVTTTAALALLAHRRLRLS